MLCCREVVIQWTDGYPRRSSPEVNFGTTPQLGQRFNGNNGSSFTDASYTRADMLGPRANSYGYFYPGAHLLPWHDRIREPFNPHPYPGPGVTSFPTNQRLNVRAHSPCCASACVQAPGWQGCK